MQSPSALPPSSKVILLTYLFGLKHLWSDQGKHKQISLICPLGLAKMLDKLVLWKLDLEFPGVERPMPNQPWNSQAVGGQGHRSPKDKSKRKVPEKEAGKF